ncbi:NAD(P)/FAD-dependent oxidoreductase [Kocuria palustris]|uniref:protoporphyrinogen/coproporphyrinogen oxidase n=1 Tax=Kocuria palustris TaxID=71999 RepID=UPI0011A34B02|nr:NAD(P)/FAD-dependent oxidoreductase [Kocuria palustris]
MLDTIVIGAGLAGLSAAWRLRHRDIAVLEDSPRVGGRLRSETRGDYVLNWGGHMFAGEGTATDRLFAETGTSWTQIPGSLAGLSMNGRLLTRGPVPSYAFRVPMPLGARAALLGAGARVSLDVLRYAWETRTRPGESAAVRQQRIYDFESRRTFQEYTGRLPEDADALFRPTVTRSAGDPDQISAGAGIGYFSLVWNIGAGLSRSILGGPSTMTEAMAAGLGDKLRLGCSVQRVIRHADHVEVHYRDENGAPRTETARTAVLATPAHVSHRLAENLAADAHEALGAIRYGSYVSAAFLTGETEPQAWDGAYGIAAPKRSFSVLINQGSIQRGAERSRRPGGSLMVFSPGSLADRLLERTDEEILEQYLEDLEATLPGSASLVEEAHVQRWHTGAPYSFPGRGRLQPALASPQGRVFLAGDYMGSLYTESAIASGFAAAQKAASELATRRQLAAGAARSDRPLDRLTQEMP